MKLFAILIFLILVLANNCVYSQSLIKYFKKNKEWAVLRDSQSNNTIYFYSEYHFLSNAISTLTQYNVNQIEDELIVFFKGKYLVRKLRDLDSSYYYGYNTPKIEVVSFSYKKSSKFLFIYANNEIIGIYKLVELFKIKDVYPNKKSYLLKFLILYDVDWSRVKSGSRPRKKIWIE